VTLAASGLGHRIISSIDIEVGIPRKASKFFPVLSYPLHLELTDHILLIE